MNIVFDQNFLVGLGLGFLLGAVVVSAAYFIFGVMISYLTTPQPTPTKNESSQ